MKTILKGIGIAESDDTVLVEGNPYSPMDSIKEEYFEKTDLTSLCGWNDGEWHVGDM